MRNPLIEIYDILLDFFGPQDWWPGDTPFEVMIGAILTQNTNWGNVQKAVRNLMHAGALTPHAIYKMENERLSELIRPAGYYNIKAKRLKSFVEFFMEKYSGRTDKIRETDMTSLREYLLGVNGIGPETADSILLYALEKPVFVIDTYTKRILSRHGIMDSSESYDSFQELFHESLPAKVPLFNEYHALLVKTGKEFCRPKPHCHGCPLKR
ncbi:endonuclease III [bacterium BMS3Abin07]|nr:endonuclease III [bacterium BMS3Abin07]GBE31211.1 endonuclease III [bacterium BMS3Bbin05]HDL20891.1 endonuclease III domain-containing protein [Nitrospirota bacterium]HDZ88421.1 endonuclease III domain-containing protein [Nitrospirota bacterium]